MSAAYPVSDRARSEPEAVIEPALPIIDPHHHLKDPPGGPPYRFAEFLQDLKSGHNIVATVVVEVGVMYRAEGPPELRSLGETEYFNGAAAMFASGVYRFSGACAGIVGFADLRLGASVGPILDAHMAIAGPRFRGVRMPAVWDTQYQIPRLNYSGIAPSPQRLREPKFREGFACLAERKLTFDTFLFHTQMDDVVDLARAFPDTPIIVNHYAGPLGIGPYAGTHKEIFGVWRQNVQKLAACHNIYMKLGGLRWGGVRVGGYQMGESGEFPVQPSSAEFAEAWHPYIDTCVEAFGAQRCMFESNFPPESVICSYRVIWNVFKRVSANYPDDDRKALFNGTAATVYGLPIPAWR